MTIKHDYDTKLVMITNPSTGYRIIMPNEFFEGVSKQTLEEYQTCSKPEFLNHVMDWEIYLKDCLGSSYHERMHRLPDKNVEYDMEIDDDATEEEQKWFSDLLQKENQKQPDSRIITIGEKSILTVPEEIVSCDSDELFMGGII